MYSYSSQAEKRLVYAEAVPFAILIKLYTCSNESSLCKCHYLFLPSLADKKRSRLGPGGGVAPILDRFVSTNMTQQQRKEYTVRQHPALAEQDASFEKHPVDDGRIFCHHHGKPTCNNFHHPNYENDSQKSAASSSTSNESHSTHTSGYQTDDGTFEGKMLHLATKSRPANIRMTAVKDYNPCCNEELVLRRGQRVQVLYKNNDWVYAMTKNGETGYIPYNYVRPSRKYAGYQSEPEYMVDTDAYPSGYETDLPMPGSNRKCGTRTQIEDMSPSFNIRTGFRSSPDNQQYNSQLQQQPQCRHHRYRQPHHHGTRHESVGSGRYTPPVSASPWSTHRSTNGYTSAVEYPTTNDTRRHPRPAKSLHNILDAGGSPTVQSVDRRPTEGKPELDSFPLKFLEELVVIHDFEAHEEDEAFVSKGERVKVLNADDSFWLWVETTPGIQGFVPRSCCSLGNHPCKFVYQLV